MNENDPKVGQDTPSEKKNEPAPYEMAPMEEVPTARAAADPGKGKAKISAPGLISDFDEDADFSRDPELDQKLRGKPEETRPNKLAAKIATSFHLPADPGSDALPLLREGVLDVKWGAVVGLALTFGGAIAAAATTKSAWFAGFVATFLACFLHAITGVGAVGIAGYFLERPTGRMDLVATRMLAATGMFAVLFNVHIPGVGHVVETGIAIAAYLGVVLLFFRVHGGEMLLIGTTHGTLWGFIALTNWASNWANAPLQPGS